MVLAALIGMLGVTSGMQSAAANPIEDMICMTPKLDDSELAITANALAIAEPQGGFFPTTAGMIENVGPKDKPWGKTAHTAYEWYGMSGLNWTMWRGSGQGPTEDISADCLGIGTWMTTVPANIIFWLVKAIAGTLLTVFSWCTDPQMITSFFEPIESMVIGMRASIFSAFLPIAIVFGSLWLLWTGMVKSRSKDSVQGAIWIVTAAGISLAFLASPMLFMKMGNTIMTEGTNVFMTATTSGLYNNKDDQDMCKRPDAGLAGASKATTCNLWRTFVYTPWSAGQFGSPAGQKIPNPTDSGTPGHSTLKGGVRFPQIDDMGLRQLDAQVLDHDQMLEPVQGIKDDAMLWKVTAQAVANSKPEYFAAWSGRSGGARVGTSLLALVAVMTGGLLVLIVAIYLLVLKVGFLMLILTAPIFLLLGIHPGFGRRIAMRWLEALIGTIVKALVVSFLLAALMGLYALVLGNQKLPWLAQMLFIVAFGLAAIMYRKRLVGMLDVINLGGGGGAAALGGAELAQGGKKAAGSTAGSAAGAAGSLASGGTLAATTLAAGKGAVVGSGSGSPARGAMTGFNQGRATAGRQNAKNNASEAADAQREKQYNDAQHRQSADAKQHQTQQTQTDARTVARKLIVEQEFVDKYRKDPSMRDMEQNQRRYAEFQNLARSAHGRASSDKEFYNELVAAQREETRRRGFLNDLANKGTRP